MRLQQAERNIKDEPATRQIEVIDLGIDAIHGQGFQMSFPEGLDRYNFAHYSCPIVLQDESGCREWPSGVSVVYAPENPRYLLAESSDLVNSWFSFRGPGVAPCLAAYQIPTNKVLDLGELPFLKPLLEEIRRERMQQALHWQDAVSDLVRAILREYGTLKSELEHEMTPAQRRLERTLRDIRMRVHSELSHRWTVPEMAAMAGLDCTWFAMVYKRQFGTSPINDLLNARLKHAEALLTQLPMTVAQIAADCGFANIEHFTRMFHQRMGCSPGQLRGRTKPQDSERNLRKDQ
jgi:AraC-like DNA-binding protein